MIPLPGLVLLIWMLRVGLGLFVVTCAACILAVASAHRSWHTNESAAAGERLAVIRLVAGLICFAFFLPPYDRESFVVSCLPALAALATLAYIRSGSRRRGLPSLGLRRALRVGLASLAGSVLVLAATAIVLRAEQARQHRLEEVARARGQANQDSFSGLVVSRQGAIVAGVTSTPPALDDDAWLLTLDRSLAVGRRHAPAAPGRQAFFALAADASG